MAHDAQLPPIPFSDADHADMRRDDISAAKMVALLTSSIFMLGVVLYTIVLATCVVATPYYSVR